MQREKARHARSVPAPDELSRGLRMESIRGILPVVVVLQILEERPNWNARAFEYRRATENLRVYSDEVIRIHRNSLVELGLVSKHRSSCVLSYESPKRPAFAPADGESMRPLERLVARGGRRRFRRWGVALRFARVGSRFQVADSTNNLGSA